MSRIGKDETSVPHRDERHAFLVIGMWRDAAEDEKSIRWIRELWSAMQPHCSGGFCVNYEAEAATDQIRAAPANPSHW